MTKGADMKASEVLEGLLPRLRRFAHACSADRKTADECVHRALEEFNKTYSAIDTKDDKEIERRIYQLVEQALEQDSATSFEKQSWRALILVVVEEFSLRETASILGVSDAELMKRLKSAEQSAKRFVGNL